MRQIKKQGVRRLLLLSGIFFIVFFCLLALSASVLAEDATSSPADPNDGVSSFRESAEDNVVLSSGFDLVKSIGSVFKKVFKGSTWNILIQTGPKDFFKELFSEVKDLKKPTSKFLGKDLAWFDLIEYFLVGFIAGFFMWGVYQIWFLFRYMIMGFKVGRTGIHVREYRAKGGLSAIGPDFREEQSRWIMFVAGQWWKVFVFGIFLAVVMQVPYINTAIRFVTLEFLWLDGSYFLRPIIIAILVGFLPSFIDDIAIAKIKAKYTKSVENIERMKVMASGLRNKRLGGKKENEK